jgi:hypothetical protein
MSRRLESPATTGACGKVNALLVGHHVINWETVKPYLENRSREKKQGLLVEINNPNYVVDQPAFHAGTLRPQYKKTVVLLKVRSVWLLDLPPGRMFNSDLTPFASPPCYYTL